MHEATHFERDRMVYLLWRGLLSNATRKHRRISAFVLMALCVSIVFMQLSFITLAPAGVLDIYSIGLLAPIAVAALALGTLPGAAIGLFAGCALYIHSIVMPLDFQELTLVTPFTSLGMFTLFGLLLGLLFAVALRKSRTQQARVASVLLACLFASLIGSLAIKALTAYTPTLPEMVLQVAIDTLITGLPCLFVARVFEWTLAARNTIGVRGAFRMSILCVVVFAFIIAATISYVTVTLADEKAACAAMESEVNYLCLQLGSLKERADAFERVVTAVGSSPTEAETADSEDYRLLSDQVGKLLDGYTLDQTGTVLILHDGQVLLSDDERMPVGMDVTQLGEDIEAAIATSIETGEVQRIVYDGIFVDESNLGGYSHNMQIAFLLAGQTGEYQVVIIEPSTMVFRERMGVIGREAAITLVILVVVFFLVSDLLNVTVAGRIDKTNEALEKITSGDLDVRVEVAGMREFKSLSRGINMTVDALNDLIEEANQRMEEDLKTARAIQQGALPKHYPAFADVDDVDLFASMDPAWEVGGDFYDYFSVNSHTVAFLVADVSGKGIPGALLMMAAKAEIENCLSSGLGVGEAIGAANDYLCANNEAGMFVTVWAATLDWKTGELTYVNAGHNWPLLRHGQGGSWEWLEERSGLVLGAFEGLPYKEYTRTLRAGDELVLYTDGVNEAFNRDFEEYGNDRLYAFLEAHADEGPVELTEGLRADVAAWTDGAEQSDDVTILVLEYGVER